MEQTLQAGLVIVGVVNGFRLLQEGYKTQNFWGFLFFVVALATGIILGFFHYFALTVETGIVAGLGSSGLYRIGEKFGGIGK